jgi:uncharacterized protein YbjT (DUF2867 family)
MNVLIFGATGMVGQGVLRECLAAADVERVQTVGRSATGRNHPKLRELVMNDLSDYGGVEAELRNFDACYFCLGVSSAGMREADYTRVTYGLTLAAAQTLARLNPRMTFVYVSGASTDSSERGRSMWARVKGRTENALLQLPFKAVYLFRPGLIQPLDGIRSRTRAYRFAYRLLRPLMPLLWALMPDRILTTAEVGQAMLAVTRRGASKAVLEAGDLAALCRPAPPKPAMKTLPRMMA